MKSLILAVAFVATSILAGPSIIPQPLEMKETGGTVELKPGAVIAYADDAAKPAAELLAEQLRPAIGFKLPVIKGAKGDVVFRINEHPALGSEGYELRVTDHVSIAAPTAAGLFYGAQGQLWSEYIPTTSQAEYMLYPRQCALAEMCWLPAEQKNFANFKDRLNTHLLRLNQQDINYRDPAKGK